VAYEWNPKSPGETVAYVADWFNQLGDEYISTFTFTVTSGDATISSQVQSDSAIKVWIAGGTDGTTTSFLNTVTTNSGQVLQRTYTLLVKEGANSYQPSTTTKRTLVGQAFNECAINGWEYDIDAAETDTALTRLDMLMWELLGRGLDLGYNFPSAIGSGDLDDTLGAPDQAVFGLAVLLAERLSPTMGKTQSRESRIALFNAMKAVQASANFVVPTMQFTTGTALGAGNKPWSTRYPFVTG
jgi:hypothetical protein